MCKLWNCHNNDCHYCKRQAERAKKKPIAKVSKKRAPQNRLDRKQNKKIRAERPLCEMKLEGCTKYTQGVQHTEGRIGANLTDVSKKIAACNNCNLRAETHPLEALEKKVSKKRIANNN